jgi:hypothetical protein
MICQKNDCGKKVTFLEQTTCKCNKCSQNYCTSHRLAEAHFCSHDYKEKKEEDVRKYIENNKCVNDKMVRI